MSIYELLMCDERDEKGDPPPNCPEHFYDEDDVGSQSNGKMPIRTLRQYAHECGWTTDGKGKDYCPVCTKNRRDRETMKRHACQIAVRHGPCS